MRLSNQSRAFALLMTALALHADVIDRIAVAVGTRVITTSDLDRQIRVTAFQNGEKPDFSAAQRRAAAEKMIEQKLIQRDLETSRYPVPEAAELVPVIAEFKAKHFKDNAAYERALAEYGITEQDFLDVLLWQRTLLAFIDVRFETGIQVTEKEIAEYAAKNKIANIADAERAVTGARADIQLDAWLKDARKRTPVVIHDEVFK
jgi:hypothetical protein